MKILFDDQIFEFQERGGISRYHVELYKGLLDYGVDAKIGVKYSNNLYLMEAVKGIKKQFGILDCFMPGLNFRGKYKLYQIYSLLHRIKNSRELNSEYLDYLIKRNFDIFHPTTYVESYDYVKKPIVITIHDMIHESYPEFFCSLKTIQEKYNLAKRADKIIAISEYTKQEILKYYNSIDPHKISVVHHGISLNVNEDFNENEFAFPYILYVGSRNEYKNFSLILRALSNLKHDLGDCKLLCVGNEFTDNELIYMSMLGIENFVINRSDVNDKELRTYYKYAECYISSSLAEGFGLPLLEAMKYRVPMILSDIPVYHEIASDCALYFDPYKVNSLVNIIRVILKSPNSLFSYIEKASNRVKMFSLDQMVKNTIKVYETLI